jgi:hypothetical protein
MKIKSTSTTKKFYNYLFLFKLLQKRLKSTNFYSNYRKKDPHLQIFIRTSEKILNSTNYYKKKPQNHPQNY